MKIISEPCGADRAHASIKVSASFVIWDVQQRTTTA